MSTIGKIVMAAGIVLYFTWLSQFNQIAQPGYTDLGKICLYSTLPVFLTGLLIYFKGKEKESTTP